MQKTRNEYAVKCVAFVWIGMESPELCFKSTRATKINLKRQSEPEFRWLSSQHNPVKIQLEMIAQWPKYCFGAKSRHIVW
jgi:hypothetical protein